MKQRGRWVRSVAVWHILCLVGAMVFLVHTRDSVYADRVSTSTPLGLLPVAAAAQPAPPQRDATASGATVLPDSVQASEVAPVAQTSVVFRSTDLKTYGKLGVVRLDAPEGSQTITALSCERVHVAAGQGVCRASSLSERKGDGELQGFETRP